MQLEETQRLLSRIRSGEAPALDPLLERIGPRVVLTCAIRMSAAMRAVTEPEDVAQEVLLQAHRDWAQFTGTTTGDLYRWVTTIAANRIRDLADHFKAQKRDPSQGGPPPPAHGQTSPAGAASRREESRRLLLAIEALPEGYRTVVLLRDVEFRTVPEIAALLGKTENAVRILHMRALGTLGRLLEVGGEERAPREMPAIRKPGS